MRISFDIDDTLVRSPSWASEQPVPWPLRWHFRERLRPGTKALLRALQAAGHDLWIYTTSYRSEGYLWWWFRSIGVRLGGVVNQRRHERVVGRQGPSKLPAEFGIHLHIDDSEGVAEEGRRHRFDVLVIAPDDENWCDRIRDAIDRRS